MDSHQKKFFKQFGEGVKKMRSNKKYTLEDMQDFGFNPQHFQKIENGKKQINLYTAYRIAKAFDLSLEKLFKKVF